MYINFEDLARNGYEVKVDATGVTITAEQPDPLFANNIYDALIRLDLVTTLQAEQLVEEFAKKVEAQQIWNVIST